MSAAICIVVPAYNAAAYLPAMLQSLLQQTMQHWEAIIVDDGSTDMTADIVNAAAAKDSRIRLLQQSNRGEAAARWAGIQQASAPYLYLLDADDCARPDCLLRLTAALDQHAETIVVYGDHRRVDAQGAPLYPHGRALSKTSTPSGDVLLPMLATPLFPIGAALIRRDFLEAQMFDSPSNYAEDWYMWVQLAAKGTFHYRGGEPLLDYRIHAHSQTHDLTATNAYLRMIDAVFALPVVQTRVPAPALARLRKQRRAYAYFALGCKALRHRAYSEAAQLLRQSLGAGYYFRPAVWLLYGFTRLGYLPRPLRRHLG